MRAVIQTRDFEEAEYLVFGTKNGVVKKTRLEAYNTPLKADGIIAIKMRDGDELVGVRHSSGSDDVLMVSRKGQAIRYHETDVRPMGRDTAGVQGMRLSAGDEVISINIAELDADLLVVTENGYGKRTRVADYPAKGRGGLGVKTVQLTDAKGHLVGARVVRDDYQVMLISTGGTMIKIPADDVKRLGRATQGVIVMRLRDGEQVSTLALVVEPEDGKPKRTRRNRPVLHTEAPGCYTSQHGASQAGGSPRADRPHPASAQARAVSRTGVPHRGDLQDAARLLDEQGPDSDEGPQAADLRPTRSRDRHADQAGEGQGAEPRRGHRGRPKLPGG